MSSRLNFQLRETLTRPRSSSPSHLGSQPPATCLCRWPHRTNHRSNPFHRCRRCSYLCIRAFTTWFRERT